MSSPSPWARWSGAIRPREERGPSGQSVGSNPHRPPDALGRGPPAPVPLTWRSGRSQESDPAGRGPAGQEGACRPPFGVGPTRGGRQGSAGELCWSPRPFTLLCSAGPRGPPHVRGRGLGVQRKAGASACPPLGPSLGREAPLGGQDASANAPPAPPWAGRGSAHTQACRLLLASASRSGSVFTARRERLRQRRPAHAAGALPAPHTGFLFCHTCVLVIPSGVF